MPSLPRRQRQTEQQHLLIGGLARCHQWPASGEPALYGLRHRAASCGARRLPGGLRLQVNQVVTQHESAGTHRMLYLSAHAGRQLPPATRRGEALALVAGTPRLSDVTQGIEQ